MTGVQTCALPILGCKNIIKIVIAYLPFITVIIIKTYFFSLHLVCFGYTVYLGFTTLISYILQVIAPEYYAKEASRGVGLKRVTVIQQIQ